MHPIFEKLHHVCLVIHDIEKSPVYYESIGIGPWIAYPPLDEGAGLVLLTRATNEPGK